MRHKKIITINTNSFNRIKDTNIQKFLKVKIFSGHIIIFRNSSIVKKIIKEVRNIVENFFCYNIFNYSSSFEKKSLNIRFLNIQKEVKKSLLIKKLFNLFLQTLDFSIHDTYIDRICIRYIPKKNDKIVGNLKHTKAHRDTWASNILEQINWWFPAIDILSNNTLFISPKYFNQKIINNSSLWSFEKYLKNKINLDSTPTIIGKVDINDKIVIKLRVGDIVCFSGHHLHGSNSGIHDRLNLETRTVTKTDSYNYAIPKMLDGNFEKKKKEWFRNCFTNRPL